MEAAARESRLLCTLAIYLNMRKYRFMRKLTIEVYTNVVGTWQQCQNMQQSNSTERDGRTCRDSEGVRVQWSR